MNITFDTTEFIFHTIKQYINVSLAPLIVWMVRCLH